METLKERLWRNPVTKYPMTFLSWIKNYIFNFISFDIKKWERLHTSKYSDYRKIRNLKNKHNGKRCFILATGPSLTLEDVQMLKEEVTFGMNSICLLFEKLGWETTYYGVQDLGVYTKLKSYYSNFKMTQLFIGDGIPESERMDINHIPFALNYLNHRYSYNKLNTQFSEDAEKCIYDGYTITYSLMQLAVYMGFKEIYLLGNDCSYSKDPSKQHFADFGHYDPSTFTARDRILFAYQYAFDFLKYKDVKIYNATRGGALEIFPRVNLEEVLNQ